MSHESHVAPKPRKGKSSGDQKNKRRHLNPKLILGVGLTGISGTAATSYLDAPQWATPASAGAASAAALILTYVIAQKQSEETNKLADMVSQVRELSTRTGKSVNELEDISANTRNLLKAYLEADAEAAYGSASESPDESATDESLDGSNANSEAPGYKDEAIESLRNNGANLDFNNLRWKQKVKLENSRGNLGWFVETPNRNERWFVRKAKTLTARKAMPRHFLNELDTQHNVKPPEIRHDYQLKDHGLAAWYARTYDGKLWKVWKPNRNSSGQILTEDVTSEDKSDE